MAGRNRTPSPGTVIGVLALIVAMGGAAYAATKIGPKQLRPNAVRTAKIQDGAVTEAKLADAAVTGAKLADGSVTSPKIADGAVNSAKLDPSERAEGFATSTRDPINLNLETGDDFTDADRVALLTLPPGSYIVNASTGIFGSAIGTDGFATCELRDDGVALANGAARRGAGGARIQGNIALTGASDGGAVDLVCQTTVTPTIARFRNITAVRVASVQTQ